MEDDCEPPRAAQSWISSRYMMTILSFLGFFNLYALRVNLSVAIVAMVNQSSSPEVNSTVTDQCPILNTSSPETENKGEFNWDSNVQGIILGSFFYGYICTQVFGGWASAKFGAKWPFGYSCLLSGILALLIPVAAKWHFGALIAIRILQGLCQGMCFPSMHAMMGQWAPPLERSRMVAITYSGVQVGTFGSLIISGVLANHLGWESVFYFFGATSCLWFILWLFCAFDSPDNHPRISEEERLYIRKAIGTRNAGHEQPFPWRKVFTSLPVWALCIANFGHNWGFYTLLTNIPSYLSKILHFNIQSNGFLSALPYFAMAIVMQISGFSADYLRKRSILSTTAVRRLFHFFGQILPAICLVLLGYSGCNVYAAIALLTLAVGSDGIATSGFQVNHVDISPNHAGLLMGISNTFGTIPGFLGPYIVGVITSSETLTEWRVVFYISAAIYAVTGGIFALLASGELEDWEESDTTLDEPLLTG